MTPAQIKALEAVAVTLATVFAGPAAGAAAEAVETVADAFIPGTVGTVPSGAIQPVKDDPNAHPVMAATGRAAQVPTAVMLGTHPASPTDNPEDAYSFPDVYDRLAAVEAKVNALIAATGMTGSAAMAAHL